MPRPLRSQLPDGTYHVTARGVDGTAIFRDDHDREAYVARLERAARRYEWRVLAYCLMDNHVHLLVETRQQQLSSGMQYLHGAYAQRFNRRYNRTGHLFGGRFASFVVDTDEHLAAALDYIRNNPVRARLVEEATAYAWSAVGGSFDARRREAPPPTTGKRLQRTTRVHFEGQHHERRAAGRKPDHPVAPLPDAAGRGPPVR